MIDINVIEGIEYEHPKQPAKTAIRNYLKEKKNQVWERHTEYLKYDWTEGWEERATKQQLKIVNDELGRLYNGEWIYINGTPIYINNYFYFFLQWMFLENEYYPEYREVALYYFRFIEICKKNKLCWGHVLIKGRRVGASSMEASILLLNALIERNTRQGIISKTGDDAKDIYDFIVIAFEALPKFLQPTIDGANKTLLSFKKPAQKITLSNKNVNKREGLNNTIGHKKTALNSWDSGKLFRVLVDEAGKWTEVDINSYIKIVGKTLTKGALVSGYASVISTVNKGDKGGDRFKILWEQSDHKKVNRLGQTTSRLFRIFIPAYEGYEGYIGKYGESITHNPTAEQTEWLKNDPRCPDPYIGARQYLEMQRELLRADEDGLAEEIRQAPFNADEVFASSAKSIYFDKNEHEKQLDAIKEMMSDGGIDFEKGELGRRGVFKENIDGTVRFEDDKKGIAYIHEFPDKPNSFEKNNTFSKVRYKPTNTSYGGAGFDPIAHADATVEKGSDACLIIRKRPQLLDYENSGKPTCMILGRMLRKSDLYTQVFLCLKFYGVRVLGERAPSDWVDWAKENGYEDFLIGTQRSDKSWVYGASPQNKDYIEEHLSVQVESSYNDVRKIWFKRLIKDRLSFDVNDRTDYDACIADGNALIACKESIKTKKTNSIIPKFVKVYNMYNL